MQFGLSEPQREKTYLLKHAPYKDSYQTARLHNLIRASIVNISGVGGNLGVIVVRVFEPVFRNLPHSYTWPLKKRTHSYTRSSEMLTYSYSAL